ncbi:MAG: hypothetical protein KDA93_27020 [Planctomycetaceae bacterium]|nr:hypothetical protein [Planctomycetaceae bacterium]
MKRSVEHKVKAMIKRYRIVRLEDVCRELDVDQEATQEHLAHHRRLQSITSVDGTTVVVSRSKPPPSEVAIARAVATYQFCQNEPTRPRLLTHRDIETYFPSVFRKGLPSSYYVRDANRLPVLGLLRVDTNLKPIARLLSKSDAMVQRHLKQGEFRQLQRSDQFELTWLVPTAAKKRSLELNIASHRIHHVAIRAFVVPELLEMLAPL